MAQAGGLQPGTADPASIDRRDGAPLVLIPGHPGPLGIHAPGRRRAGRVVPRPDVRVVRRARVGRRSTRARPRQLRVAGAGGARRARRRPRGRSAASRSAASSPFALPPRIRSGRWRSCWRRRRDPCRGSNAAISSTRARAVAVRTVVSPGNAVAAPAGARGHVPGAPRALAVRAQQIGTLRCARPSRLDGWARGRGSFGARPQPADCAASRPRRSSSPARPGSITSCRSKDRPSTRG